MDCKAVFLLLVVAILVLCAHTEGRTKKVVIHVPYKVKKIKHTHTVYKTVRHRPLEHEFGASDDHEHFHHLHVRDEQPGFSNPVPGLAIPEFLPDAPIELPLDMPDAPHDDPLGARHLKLFRRNKVA